MFVVVVCCFVVFWLLLFFFFFFFFLGGGGGGGWGFVLQTIYRSGYDINQISLFRSRKFDWQHYLSLVLSFMFYMQSICN